MPEFVVSVSVNNSLEDTYKDINKGKEHSWNEEIYTLMIVDGKNAPIQKSINIS